MRITSIGAVIAGLATSCSGDGTAKLADLAPGEVFDEATSTDIAPAAKSEGRRRELHDVLEESPNNIDARLELEELDARSREAAGLLLDVELGERHHLYFMEPEPGRIYVSELGTDLDNAVLTQQPLDTIREIYEAARPGEILPEVLEGAVARQLERALSYEDSWLPEQATATQQKGEPAPASDPALAPRRLTHVSGSGAHFRDDQGGCPHVGPDEHRSFCWLERSGNWTESDSATHETMVLAMFAGDQLTWHTRAGSASSDTTLFPGDFFINKGTGPSAPWWEPWCDVDRTTLSGEIRDAQGFVDMWHWGGSFSRGCSRFATISESDIAPN